MITLLAILAVGLAVGRWARHLTPALELLLFLAVASVVLAQLVAWESGLELDVTSLLGGSVPRGH